MNALIVATHNGSELFATPGRPTAPSWSPDGKVLVCALGRIAERIALVEVQVQSGAEREIGAWRWSNLDSIAWLPDGSGLMLTARDQLSQQTQVWYVAYPSGEAHRVTNDLNEYQGLSLNADAKAMVVVQTARDADLWVVPSGKPAEARAVTAGADRADGAYGISWTPDGKLVYGSNASGNRDIWLLDIARGTRNQLTADARQNYYPQVTPDGRSVLFLSDRGDKPGIWRMDIDGSNPRHLIAAQVLRFACSAGSGSSIRGWADSRGTGASGPCRSAAARPDG